MSNIGNRIKQLRKENRITQDKLANIIGVTKATICHYEKGDREPSDDIKEKLADYFNVDMNYLFGITEIKRESDKAYNLDLEEQYIMELYRSLDNEHKDLFGKMLKAVVKSK